MLFLSRAGADSAFAEEIGRILEAAGFAVTLQQWDFANRNFMERIHASLTSGMRVVALLSPDYLKTDYCSAEWQNTLAGDPLNTKGRLIVLRVGECEPVGLLAGIAYWDLVPMRDNRPLLQDVLLAAVREGRGDAAPAAAPYWRGPRTILDPEAIRPTPTFTGREPELAALAAALADDPVAVVHGLGGMGKSALAREYAWRQRDGYAVVWWLNAQTESGIVDGLLRLGALFVRGLDQLADRRAAALQVITTVLSGFERPVLLVFDNLESEELLRTWRPRTACRLLVTTRDAAWGDDVAAVALQTWHADEAVAYLRHNSGRADLDVASAGALAEALGYLPLALAHAAAYLRGNRTVTPRRYLERLADHLVAAPRNAEYPRSVFATFQAAVTEAERQAPGAAALLCLASWFGPDAIPDELLRGAPEADRPALSPSLPDGVAARFADAARLYERAAGIYERALGPDHEHVGAALNNLASIYCNQGRFAEAEPLCLRAIAIWQTALGPDHPHLALPLNNLGYMYIAQRRYAESEACYTRSLRIREAAIGPDHPGTATSLHGLADLYVAAGRYAEAEPLLHRAREVREKTLGADHSHVAACLASLASAYVGLGRAAEAQTLAERALALRERAHDPEHPLVAASLTNLAAVYETQGRNADAQPLLARALTIQTKALGREHPTTQATASSLERLAARA